ncbi:ATP-binding protein [Labrenzia sp. R5_0]|jgi:two-component system sensor histidine kinase CreC|uniref:sensor histidine kinase n=1 Tax=Labrenzia sp. R5_0 TaxID=2821108 RepID=UPI001ADAF120|nr:ATP-binding protein [Labrenzia sp. R5_0]MBO9459354.1 two-component sensor histidine kinase [Labrenzia sp. R5_0]
MILSRTFRDKWRPPLSLVVAGVLGIMLLVPLAGVAFFRVYENQLIETTEAELIGQSAAIAAAMAQRLEEIGGADLPLGPEVAKATEVPGSRSIYLRNPGGSWTPQLPELDLTRTNVLPGRGAPRPAAEPPLLEYLSAGQAVDRILQETQKKTLAGFRVLDFNGVIIAGREDIGLSLAHVEEIKRALSGHYASALRERIVDNPQPIYSISRGTSVRVFVAMPIIVSDRVAGVVYASRTPSNILKEMFVKREAVFWVVVFVLAATFVVGFIFARAITGPIKALTRRSLAIGNGEREALVPLAIHGNREIHALSESMLDMSRKLFDRNDYISTFANHVTHELKTPLTSIQGAAELLKDEGAELSEADREKFLGNILHDTERASKLLNRLRDLARADSVEIGGSCRLSAVATALRRRFEGLEIDLSGDADLPMSAENARIVFENLIDNSRRHAASRVSIVAVPDEKGLTVQVQDDGEGISEGNQDQIFELFFTTRRQSGGTGMGLGIVQALLKAHGAAIRLLPGAGGATFELSFPVRPPAISPASGS